MPLSGHATRNITTPFSLKWCRGLSWRNCEHYQNQLSYHFGTFLGYSIWCLIRNWSKFESSIWQALGIGSKVSISTVHAIPGYRPHNLGVGAIKQDHNKVLHFLLSFSLKKRHNCLLVPDCAPLPALSPCQWKGGGGGRYCVYVLHCANAAG